MQTSQQQTNQDGKDVTDDADAKQAAYQARVRAALQKYQDGPKRRPYYGRTHWPKQTKPGGTCV